MASGGRARACYGRRNRIERSSWVLFLARPRSTRNTRQSPIRRRPLRNEQRWTSTGWHWLNLLITLPRRDNSAELGRLAGDGLTGPRDWRPAASSVWSRHRLRSWSHGHWRANVRVHPIKRPAIARSYDNASLLLASAGCGAGARIQFNSAARPIQFALVACQL